MRHSIATLLKGGIASVASGYLLFIYFIIIKMRNQRKQEVSEKRINYEPPAPIQKITHAATQNGASNPLTRNLQSGKLHQGYTQSPSSTKINPQQRNPPVADNPNNHSKSNSIVSREKPSESFLMVDRVVQLHERLKNIHHFYKTRIQDEKERVSQRNEVFMGIIEELQRAHNEKVEALRKLVDEAEGEKKDVGLVDERMNEIKGSIDDILKQSADLKSKNERLERQINEKAHSLREKEEELGKLKEELMESRNELEGFERLNLRENKRSKEISSMIIKAREATASRE